MRTYAKPVKRGLPPCVTHEEMAAMAGITEQKLTTYKHLPDFPATRLVTRSESTRIWYSKPDALAFIAKHLTVKA